MQTGKVSIMSIFRVMGIMLIIPVVLIFSTHLIMCQNFIETFLWFPRMLGFALFETVIIYFLAMLIYGICSRLWVATLIIGCPYVFLTLVSYYKQVINGMPLLMGDFQMIGQFGEIAKFAVSQISFSAYTWCGILIPLALCLVLFFVDRKIKAPHHRLIFIPVASVVVILFFFTPVFSNWAVMMDDIDKFEDQRTREYGPSMGLYCTYAQGKKSSEIYKEDTILRIMDQVDAAVANTQAEEKTPTVIFILSESFFDVAKLDNVEYNPDPIPNFHRISKEFQSGDFLTSAYCGGTGNVEMEVLTGICSHLLKSADSLTYLPQEDAYRKIPSISDVFKSYGYKTVYMHSYNTKLYNREKIYSQFEFDEVLFEDDFLNPEYRGGYISDSALADKIISVYEEKGEEKLFLYAVSVENHQPYMAGKFPKPVVNINTDLLNDEEIAVFDSYITGVHDADKALGKLVRYFSKKDEPVMLVFYGDHMPNLKLNDEDSVFTKLGYIECSDTSLWDSNALKKMLSTDYVIWTNYQDKNFEDGMESSIFLGTSVLERLGLEMTDYYRWLSGRVMPNLLMYRSRLYVDENGECMESIPETDSEVMEDYAVGIYDIIYGDNRIFKLNR